MAEEERGVVGEGGNLGLRMRHSINISSEEECNVKSTFFSFAVVVVLITGED